MALANSNPTQSPTQPPSSAPGSPTPHFSTAQEWLGLRSKAETTQHNHTSECLFCDIYVKYGDGIDAETLEALRASKEPGKQDCIADPFSDEHDIDPFSDSHRVDNEPTSPCSCSCHPVAANSIEQAYRKLQSGGEADAEAVWPGHLVCDDPKHQLPDLKLVEPEKLTFLGRCLRRLGIAKSKKSAEKEWRGLFSNPDGRNK